jgi:hypothetical protein
MQMTARRPEDLQREQDDEWLDEALRETFPASDPIPSFRKDRQIGSPIDEQSQDPVGTEWPA